MENACVDAPDRTELAAVNRAAAGAVPAAGGLGDAPVDGQVLQHQADHAVIGLPGDLLQLREVPRPDPLVAPFADRGGPAGAVGDRRIGAAEPEDLDELLEDDAVADPGAVAAQRVRCRSGRP